MTTKLNNLSKLVMLLLIITPTVFSQDITNTIAPSGKFIVKDASNNFFTLDQSTGQVNILKTLRLGNTTSSTMGIIFKGTDRFIHDYSASGTGKNTFVGINAGNFSMAGASSNTAVGNVSLTSLTSGNFNSALGSNSLYSNTTGLANSAFGAYTLSANQTGGENSAFGSFTLYSNTAGIANSAFGAYTLFSNTTAHHNSAFGYYTLYSNTTGNNNSAFGPYTLYSNTTGNNNSAFGYNTLSSNTTGLYNSALGYQSLMSNITGYNNSAFGYNSLSSNTTGGANAAFGTEVLHSNTTGEYNSGFGHHTLSSNTTGGLNSAFGSEALFLNTIGFRNTGLGHGAGSTITTGSNLTCIGYYAQPSAFDATNQITLGNSSITSLRCNTQTITSLSDARDKKNIKNLDLGIDFLMKIKPRQFNWDKREWYENNTSDGSKMKETATAGFIAQELDEVQTTGNAEWLNLVLKDNPEKWEATPGNLLPIMVKAIQDLKTEKDKEIANLKSENDDLKKEVKSLKSISEKLVTLEQMVNELISEKHAALVTKN